jgi:quinol-cytochrome oxidoreductase complex cytochrome b subunit
MKTRPKSLARAANELDERVGGARFLSKAMRKAFPDHWSFLLGEIAMYSFAIILVTGVFLTFFFTPSMNEVVYQGTYRPLHGLHMSEAYASALNISTDVRGGLLVRQIHHWATILFLAAIVAHMLRNFFTGAFRKPRDLNWMIGVVLFMLVLLNGLFGYSLPDDLLSGTGLRILAGVILAIPVVGTYLSFFLFGGEFPGEILIQRLFTIHILLIPGLLLALLPLHAVVLTWRQTHTQFPGKGSTNHTVRGYPFYPVFIAKTAAFFLWVLGVTTLLATFFQINPIWLFGPYDPAAISAGSQPDWYMGFMEGALRLMPSWEINAFGHTLSMSVLIAAGGLSARRTLDHRRPGDPPSPRPAARRARPYEHRDRGLHAVRRVVARGRERPAGEVLQHSAVPHDVRLPRGRVHRAGHRLHRDLPDLPGPAAS